MSESLADGILEVIRRYDELLKALKEAVAELKSDYDQNWRGIDTPPGYGDAFAKYEEVIARAEGKTRK